MAQLVELSGSVGRKVSRTVTGVAASAWAWVKWNRYEDFVASGDEVNAATAQRQATGALFTANGAADTGINAYTGASGAAGTVTFADANANTVAKSIAIINGVGVGQPGPTAAGYMIRYRAGLGDARPGTSLDADSGTADSATSIMLGGESRGYALLLNGANTPTAAHRVALGTGGAKSGGGQVFADHFESDYVTDTSGNRFPVRDAPRRQEEQPGLARYQVWVTDIQFDAAFASNAKIINVYDISDNLVASYPIGSANTVAAVSETNPLVMPIGSPAFIEGSGTGVLTDGPLSASGFIRVA